MDGRYCCWEPPAEIAQSMFTRPARMMWEFAESIGDDIQEIASELSTLIEGEEETGDAGEDERQSEDEEDEEEQER